MTSNVIIRDARREDCPEIIRLIKELACFEKMPNSPNIDYKTLERDGFDLKKPLYKCLVVEDPNRTEHESPSKLLGYAIFYYGYSTWHGKTLYLEDILITENYRGKGLGAALFKKVCQTATKEHCEVIYFVVLNWNPASEFYKNYGAEDLTETGQWHFYYLAKKDIDKAGKVTQL